MELNTHTEYQLHLAKNFTLKKWAREIIEDNGIERVNIDWRDNDAIRSFLMEYPSDLEKIVERSANVLTPSRTRNR